MKNKEDIQNLTKLWEERYNEEESWIKQSISVIAIILGLIISLKSGASKGIIEYIFFISAITLNGLCIFCGLIFLYARTNTRYSLILNYTKYIESHGDDGGGGDLIQAAPRKIFGILRVCFFVLLILSILSLIIYSAFSAFPENI